MIAVFLLYAVAASSITIQKVALQYFSPMAFVALRGLIGGSLLLGIVRSTRCHVDSFLQNHWRSIIKLAFTVTFIPAFCKLAALGYMSSIKVGFFSNTIPFFTALLAYLLYGQKLTKNQMLGMLVAFGGVLLILLEKTTSTEGGFIFGSISWAECLLIFGYGINQYGWLSMQHFLKTTTCSVREINGFMMIFGGTLALISAYFLNGLPSMLSLQHGSFYLLYVTLTANVIGYVAHSYFLRKYSATLLSLAAFTRPLWIALFGTLFLGEKITPTFIGSTVLVLLGILLFYRGNKKAQA